MIKILLCILLISKSILSFVAAAEVQWSAFGTLGLTLADSNQLGYRNNIDSDEGVFAGDIDFKSNSLLGGQVDLSLGNNFDFLGQVVLQDINDAKASDYVTIAFIKYSPSANWSMRLGRLVPDLFKITEYRNINIAYTWTSVPNEVYGAIPFSNLDGGDITYKTRLTSGTISYKFILGESKSIIHSHGRNEHFKLSRMFGTSMTYDQFDWNLQARYTKAKFGNNSVSTDLLSEQIDLIPDALWPNKLDFIQSLTLKDTVAEYYSFSGQKEWDNWLFSFELGRLTSETQTTTTINNGYLSGAYRQGANTYYGLFAKTTSDTYVFDEPINTDYFPELIEGIERLINSYNPNQQTFSIGWRWDISSNFTSKLQINMTDIDQFGNTLWIDPNNDNSARTVTSMMFNVSFTL